MSRGAPPFNVVTKLVARAFGITPALLTENFRVATREDMPAIVALRRIGIGSGMAWDDEQYLRWRYSFDLPADSAPFGQLFVLYVGDRLAGMIGAECVSLVHGDEKHAAMSLMDVLVDNAFEGTGLGVWLNMAVFERCPLIFEVGANANSLGVIDRLYQRLPNRTCYGYPLHVGLYVRRRIRIRWIAATTAAIVNSFLGVVRTLTFRRTPGRWQFRPISRFDAGVDALFLDRANAEICVERNARWLNWRLFDNPRTRTEVIGAYAGEKLEGYIALCRRRVRGRLEDIEIADFMIARSQEKKLLRPLIGEAMRRADSEGADFVRATVLGARTGYLLRSLGFIARQNKYWTVGVHTKDAALHQTLLDGTRWFVTDANTDKDRP